MCRGVAICGVAVLAVLGVPGELGKEMTYDQELEFWGKMEENHFEDWRAPKVIMVTGLPDDPLVCDEMHDYKGFYEMQGVAKGTGLPWYRQTRIQATESKGAWAKSAHDVTLCPGNECKGVLYFDPDCDGDDQGDYHPWRGRWMLAPWMDGKYHFNEVTDLDQNGKCTGMAYSMMLPLSKTTHQMWKALYPPSFASPQRWRVLGCDDSPKAMKEHQHDLMIPSKSDTHFFDVEIHFLWFKNVPLVDLNATDLVDESKNHFQYEAAPDSLSTALPLSVCVLLVAVVGVLAGRSRGQLYAQPQEQATHETSRELLEDIEVPANVE